MSRKTSDSSTSRLKISNPQPYQPPSRAFPPSTYNPSSSGVPAPRHREAEAGDRFGGYNVPGQGSTTSVAGYSLAEDIGKSGPARPARSDRRGPAMGNSSRGTANNSPTNDADAPTFASIQPFQEEFAYGMDHHAQPGQTQWSGPTSALKPRRPSHSDTQARPSYSQGLSIPLVGPDLDDMYSPISPVATGPSASPWDRDRSQRNELLDHQQEQAARDGKLRNAVGAFMSAGTAGRSTHQGGRSKSRDGNRRPSDGRRQNGNASRREPDVMLGYGGREFDGVDSVIRKIQRDFPDILDKDFAPSTLALALLQPSSTKSSSPSLPDFLALHSSLSQTLSSAVQTHYQVYAASLPAHATLLTALGRAQAMVKETKKDLKESRELLSGGAGLGMAESGASSGKRAEMGMLWQRERALKSMLKHLDTIDILRTVPDKVETLIGDKRFLQAALILVRSIKLINREELLEVPALSELRGYLTAQQGALTEILIEELHSHLYLKTFYTDNRWVAYQKGQTGLTLPKDSYQPDQANLAIGSTSVGDDAAGSKAQSRLSRYLSNLSVRPTRNPMLDISDEELFDIANVPAGGSGNGRNGSLPSVSLPTNQSDGLHNKVATPEADSLAYIEALLESLAAIGKLGYALEVGSQRIATELFALIENTIEEVSERGELRRADAISERPTSAGGSEGHGPNASGATAQPVSLFTNPGLLPSQDLLRVAALESAGNTIQVETLRDLFWTVFSKLRAVLEGHRLVHEVATRLSMRRDLRDPFGKADVVTISPLEEVVKPMRSEIRVLLHDYLTDQDRGSISTRRPLMTINEVLRDNRMARDRRKILFKFSDTDNKVVGKSVTSNTDHLNKVLQASVPGLVTVQENAGLTALAVEERTKDGAQHKLLVTPNSFNASTLFQPYIVFVAAVKECISINFQEEDFEGGFGTYMDEFVAKVYLPQLEEKVTSVFQANVSGTNAFVTEATPPALSKQPLVKSAIRVLALVNSLCLMLATTPFSREDYSRLIIGVMVRYYQQCNSHFKDIVMSDPAKLPLPALWAQREDFIACMNDLAKADPENIAVVRQLGQQETKLEFETQGLKPVDKRELLLSKERFEALSSLCYSLRWLVSQLSRLKITGEDDAPDSALDRHVDLYDIPSAMTSPPSLTLSSAMAQRFDTILLTYTQLADIALYTLRLEVRCRAMYHVYTALSKGNYRSEVEDYEPDPHVSALTSDMTECDAVAESRLLPRDRRFIFLQLGTLVDNLLVMHGRTVRYASDAGIWKIKRNILAVQQSLLNVTEDRGGDGLGLERAKAYWDLYFAGPKAMLEGIQDGRATYTFDEYNHMLNLQCKVDPRASMRLSGINFHGPKGGSTAAANMGRVRAGEGAVDSDRTTYNEYLIDLHSLGLEEWK